MDGERAGRRPGRVAGLLMALLVSLLGLVLSGSASTPNPFAALRLSRLGAGREAPAFHLKALDGRRVRLEELTGRVVLVNFWATWCGSCREEMPALDRLRRQFDPAHFALLTVTTEVRPREIQTFLNSLGLGLPVLLDEEQEMSAAYLVRGLPTTVLIGRDGKLVGRAVGPRAWDSPEAVALVRSLIEAVP
ncbi:TlpA family protein disulfide reductase [Nitrospira sp. Kam-Ns4a]